jgi:hypothetical protein
MESQSSSQPPPYATPQQEQFFTNFNDYWVTMQKCHKMRVI